MSHLAVAYCSDMTMRKALHVSVLSLLQKLSPATSIKLYFALDGFEESDKAVLSREVLSIRQDTNIEFLSLDPTIFHGLPTLHGSQSVYYRLVLPCLVSEERLLYIDADTLIQDDLSGTINLDMQGYVLCAVLGGKVYQALDKQARLATGSNENDEAFNSGILLFDCIKWQERKLTDVCLEFARGNKDKLISHDQTILNCLFYKEVGSLPSGYNSGDRYATILHFRGSPKPWDVGGRWLVPWSEGWHRTLEKSVLTNAEKRIGYHDWKRVPHLLGSYKRSIINALNKRNKS